MTAIEVSETPADKKSLSKKDSLSDEKKDDCDVSVVSSGPSKAKSNKNWLGKEVKRPRAEYQAEIDALKLKLAEMETDLENKTIELKQFKDWVSMAPSAFWSMDGLHTHGSDVICFNNVVCKIVRLQKLVIILF